MSFKLVKLHATGSTNEELKLRFRESELPQLTTIYTDHQTAGKGQMGATWSSEPFKNLTFSTLLTNMTSGLTEFEINKCITVVLVEWMREKLQIQAIIKWPNDILSVHHKLAGILVENIYSGTLRTCSIVGIGLNVNQIDFGNVSKAISLQQITGKAYDLTQLLIDFMEYFEKGFQNPSVLISRYESHLFKYRQKSDFRKNGKVFTATVMGTDSLGRLLLDQNGVVTAYDLKQVEWIF